MSDVSTLKNITPDEVKKFRAAMFGTREQIWTIVDNKLEVGIGDIAKGTGISEDRLVELLEADALDEAENLGVPRQKSLQRFAGLALSWFRRHWFDATVLGAFLALLFLVLHAVCVHRAEYSMQVVLTTSGGLPAFHAITKNEVTLRRTRRIVGSFGKVEDTIGTYPTAPIAEGAVLRSEQLKSDPALLADLTRRSLLQVPVKSSAPEATMKLPLHVFLLLSPRADANAAQAAVLKDVILLAIRRDGDSSWASVAVLPDQLAVLSSLLGSADVFVVQTAP